jgi:hypothetical protein
MTSTRRRKTLLVALVATLLMTLLTSAAPAATAAAKPTWQLMDYSQKTCYVSTRGGTSYYGIWISGHWNRKINVGASGLPSGGSYYTSYAPIPPGSSDGIGSLAYVAVVLPAGSSVGTYTASLWAADRVTRESVPITLVVNASSCHSY